MKKQFLKKFLLASRVVRIRKEIYRITKTVYKTLHEYWERLKHLCASFSNHQISHALLIQYFYERLVPSDRSTINAASGGTLVSKTSTKTRQLISTMVENALQFGMRAPDYSTSLQEVSELRAKLVELTILVKHTFFIKAQQP